MHEMHDSKESWRGVAWHGMGTHVLSSRVDARGPIDDEKIATIAIGRVESTFRSSSRVSS